MTIAVFATQSVPLDAVVARLTAEGVNVRGIDWDSLRLMKSESQEITKGVLIVPTHGSAEYASWVSRVLPERDLILCAPRPDNEGSGLLKRMGVTEIITPRSWDPAYISERILGQLILRGDVEPFRCGSLFGGTRAMRELFQDVATIAPLSDPILIIGPTGTGKELVAREIHNLSKRTDGLLPINCGELSMELVGSELFGHKRGAFTGAIESRRGVFAAAGNGTVFLDEIGELDLRAQTILLRVLEENRIRPLGATRTEGISARILLATNRELERECELGRFRRDVFERIRGFTVELPPLSERRADIPLLVTQFLKEFNHEHGLELSISNASVDGLFHYEWPGNVRELRSCVRKAAAYAGTDGFVSTWHMLESTKRQSRRSLRLVSGAGEHYVSFDPEVDTWREFLDRAQSTYFDAIVAASGGNKTEACRRSGLSSSQFYQKLSKRNRRKQSDEEQ